jgi:geranylgeranyl reductase family protein
MTGTRSADVRHEPSRDQWDLVVVGAGPAGAAAALAALAAQPRLNVLMLDRVGFPRDKSCGDGIAPHVLDILATVGVTGLVDDHTPVEEFSLWHRGRLVHRRMRRPVWVVPRVLFDHRLTQAAVAAGAELRPHRVRSVRVDGGQVVVDEVIRSAVVVGADGAHSVVRRAVGMSPVRRRALALRGYAPTRPDWSGRQLIVFGDRRQPAYAWSFDRGDGLSNVGYGELLDRGHDAVSRQRLLSQLETLIPGAASTGGSWRAHPLPLSSARWQHPAGRVLLAGDAAGLVNPMTGEGIYYAVATGVLAGRAAAAAVSSSAGDSAGERYAAGARRLLSRHLRHTAAGSRLASISAVRSSGVRAATADQRIFDDLVEIGLAQGTVTPRLAASLLRHLMR